MNNSDDTAGESRKFDRALLKLEHVFSFGAQDSTGLVLKAEKNRTLLRRTFCFVGAVAIYVAFVSNSPSYSAVELIRGLINSDNSGKTLPAITIPGKGEVSTYFLLQAVAFLAFYLLLSLQISLRDRFSDNSYLNSIKKSEDGGGGVSLLLKPWLRDLRLYSQLVPSERVRRLCPQCSYQGNCPAVIDEVVFKEKFSFSVWRRLYYSGEIQLHHLKRLVGAGMRCKASYYVRLVGCNVAYITTLVFIAHRALEFFGRRPVEMPPLAILVPALGVGVVVLFGFLNNPSKDLSHSGVWADFNGAVNEVCSYAHKTTSYVEEYKGLVCSRSSSKKFIFVERSDRKAEKFSEQHRDLLGKLLLHLDDLVLQKLLSIGRAHGVSAESCRTSLYAKSVAKSVVSFYEKAVPEADGYRCMRVVDVNLRELLEHSHRRNLIKDLIEKSVTENGFATINSGNIPDGAGFKDGVKSLIALPIKMSILHSDGLGAILNGHIRRKWSRGYGWLVVAADSDKVFSEGSGAYHFQLLLPFVHRMFYELARDDLLDVKTGVKR